MELIEKKYVYFQSFSPSKFSEVCQKNGIWLHLEGHALAALALVNENGAPTPNADSLSLTIGSWIGVPAVPFVTLYKVLSFAKFCVKITNIFKTSHEILKCNLELELGLYII